MAAMTIPQVTLPEILPVFPLTGVMLLPGTVLPLHIFEPRYRNMVEDALGGDKVFGMIQPFTPQDDNRGTQPEAANTAPDLYKVGCAGFIEKSEKLPDGRFFVQLKGVNRFRFAEESSLQRGYRRVKAIYREFPDAGLEQGWQCQRAAVLEALALYGKAHGMQVRPDQAGRFSDLELVNLLGVSLPFHPAEKQALLEAPTLKNRETMLIDLLRLGAGPIDADPESAPRTLN
jgi:Lon protease-like protein